MDKLYAKFLFYEECHRSSVMTLFIVVWWRSS